MLDKAELDFGIYRIMNQKRKDIEQFLEVDLLPQVKEVLNSSKAIDAIQLKRQIDNEIEIAKKYGNTQPEELPQVQELKAQYERIGDLTSIENEVFSLLANFFKRYFDNGDFISMRRYKKDVYAIPYEGEEVKLHWANADQYYIKTSEYFKVYRFKLSNGKTVCFELVEASTEQNNNKTQGDKERRFAIYADKVCETVGNEFKIYFTYEPTDKKVKQSELLGQAFDALKTQIPQEFLDLLSLKPTEKDKQRTLLQKHLNDYTARNTFDYFIHKDLGGFLTRELDFYIKNEVLFIDDLNTRDEQEFLKQLSKIKAIKKIGEKIIAFLAQLENFQKKLWLKKKMVVECNYCITLDRVPKDLYPEILNNQPQIQEWIKLFAIDEIKAAKAGGLFTEDKVGFTNPLTLEFLNHNQFLVLDTAFFSETFKWQSISSIENFDDACDGLMINSDNFQALSLIKARFSQQAKTIYIDPPYNTSASEIVYKNNYKHSSWLSLMYDRLIIGRDFLREDGIKTVTIDDVEVKELHFLLESIYSRENVAGLIAIRINPSGRPTTDGLALSHEYAIMVKNTEKSKVIKIDRSDEQKKRFNLSDKDGIYEQRNFRREGSNSNREDGKRQWYPIYVNEKDLKLRVPEMEWNDDTELWSILEKEQEGEKVIYPINDEGVEKNWRWSWENVKKDYSQFYAKYQGDKIQVYYKYRPNEDGTTPLTFWADSKYSATEHGTKPLKDLFPINNFSYPKSIYAVEDTLLISGLKKRNGLVLDYFSGSGTTGHAVINLNRVDNGNRKFILVEMGEYFDTVTKPRIQKVIYSKDWKDGKPVSREGISHCFKYMRLESYEDTLNNLALKQTETQQKALDMNPTFKEGYMLNYMLDVEAKDSLLNLEWFVNPFNCYQNITKNNELQPTKVDLVETFNYLIGLVVENYAKPKEGYVVVTGKNLAGEKILVVWRDCTQHNSTALNQFLEKSKYNPLDAEFDRIYVNGDNNVENLKTGDERWKVVLIEEEFGKRMFEMN
ncbi:site-specific DNA-methyltransferase [Flavobacterium sp.]|uniref:site-specific DNA-methyltransferase n=1 Tax=Flavobacterium sp. TaxID=239 RepID=UPI003BAC1EFB